MHTLAFDGYKDHPEDIGGHWHPANSKHQKMADQLVPVIKDAMNW